MSQDKFFMLDDIAVPNQYVTPFSEADISHILRFRRICRQYHIKFSTASPEAKDFVMTLADADCQ